MSIIHVFFLLYHLSLQCFWKSHQKFLHILKWEISIKILGTVGNMILPVFIIECWLNHQVNNSPWYLLNDCTIISQWASVFSKALIFLKAVHDSSWLINSVTQWACCVMTRPPQQEACVIWTWLPGPRPNCSVWPRCGYAIAHLKTSIFLSKTVIHLCHKCPIPIFPLCWTSHLVCV